MNRRLFAVLILIGLAGCKGTVTTSSGPPEESVAETAAPEKPPPLPGNAVYRPKLTFGGRTTTAGTGFVITTPSGKPLMLTAAHLLEPSEWVALRSAAFVAFTGGGAINVSGKPDYVGKEFDQLPALDGGVPNTAEDFAIWELVAGTKVAALPLADHEPRVNE